jgi:hypothetical protein
MWPRRAADLATIAALATIVTIAIAAPVLRAPSERLFGMEIAGRHHDPFTMMRQFDGPLTASVYSQPVTDVMGSLLARASGPVAAYNWLVLLSFPLSAVAAFLLARYLGLSSAGATVAAMAYAFSPFHLAQAAYQPHIAQRSGCRRCWRSGGASTNRLCRLSGFLPRQQRPSRCRTSTAA